MTSLSDINFASIGPYVIVILFIVGIIIIRSYPFRSGTKSRCRCSKGTIQLRGCNACGLLASFNLSTFLSLLNLSFGFFLYSYIYTYDR